MVGMKWEMFFCLWNVENKDLVRIFAFNDLIINQSCVFLYICLMGSFF